MSRLLSQDEVRALLQQPEVEETVPSAPSDPASVEAYDFRDRQRMPSSRLRYLQFLHDRFAQQLSLALSAYLRNQTSVEFDRVRLSSARRILHDLPDPIAMFIASASGGGSVALIVENELALGFVDRLLGGTAEDPPRTRALTEIEQRVLEALAEVVLSTLSHSWSPIIEETLTIEKIETRPGLVTLEPPEEGRVVLKFKVALGGDDQTLSSDLSVVLPMSVANPLSTELAKDLGNERHGATLSPDKKEHLESLLLRTPMELTVELAARGVTAGDLVRIEPGHVLNLGRAIDDPATAHVGRIPKFEAVLALREGQPAVELKRELETQ